LTGLAKEHLELDLAKYGVEIEYKNDETYLNYGV
jgi:hypothetical protein